MTGTNEGRVCREKWFDAVYSTFVQKRSIAAALSEERQTCEDFLTLSREGMSGKGKKRPLTGANLPNIIPVVEDDQPGPSQAGTSMRRSDEGMFRLPLVAELRLRLLHLTQFLWRFAAWMQESETVFQAFVGLAKANLPTSRRQLRASFPDVFAMVDAHNRNPVRELMKHGLILYLDRRGNYQITLLGWNVSQGDVKEILRLR